MAIRLFDPETEEAYIDGQRVTAAMLDQMEARAMKGVKIPKKERPWLQPGGKSLSGDGSHSPVLRLVVSRDTCDEVARRAKSENMSVSRWLRSAVEEKLAA